MRPPSKRSVRTALSSASFAPSFALSGRSGCRPPMSWRRNRSGAASRSSWGSGPKPASRHRVVMFNHDFTRPHLRVVDDLMTLQGRGRWDIFTLEQCHPLRGGPAPQLLLNQGQTLIHIFVAQRRGQEMWVFQHFRLAKGPRQVAPLFVGHGGDRHVPILGLVNQIDKAGGLIACRAIHKSESPHVGRPGAERPYSGREPARISRKPFRCASSTGAHFGLAATSS